MNRSSCWECPCDARAMAIGKLFRWDYEILLPEVPRADHLIGLACNEPGSTASAPRGGRLPRKGSTSSWWTGRELPLGLTGKGKALLECKDLLEAGADALQQKEQLVQEAASRSAARDPRIPEALPGLWMIRSGRGRPAWAAVSAPISALPATVSTSRMSRRARGWRCRMWDSCMSNTRSTLRAQPSTRRERTRTD